MGKLSLYTDETVYTHLLSDDVISISKFWMDLYKGTYNICVSDVTLELIQQCPKESSTFMMEFLEQIKYHYDEIRRCNTLARTHIDGAIAMECDMLVSWDFDNIVNKKNIDRVRKFSNLQIYAPCMLLG